MREAGLQPVATDVWQSNVPLKILGGEIGHRMTVIRLGNGKLVLHSPTPLTAELKQAIFERGPVGYIIAPSLYHDLWLEPYQMEYPQALLAAVPGFAKVQPMLTIRHTLESSDHFCSEPDMAVLLVEGMPKLNEAVFLHRPSRTLIVADLAFNLCSKCNTWNSIFRRLVGAHQGFGPDYIIKLMIKDKAATRASIDKILQWDFDRIVVGHGDILETGGKEALREAYAFLD